MFFREASAMIGIFRGIVSSLTYSELSLVSSTFATSFLVLPSCPGGRSQRKNPAALLGHFR